MKKEFAEELESAIKEAATVFSDPSRQYNYEKETFEKGEVFPLSETAAAVVFMKSSGKKAVAFFYRVKNYWKYFFPTDSHILGMAEFGPIKAQVEKFNYPVNFKPEAMEPEKEKFINQASGKPEDEEIPF
jgi:hypothetical protein